MPNHEKYYGKIKEGKSDSVEEEPGYICMQVGQRMSLQQQPEENEGAGLGHI